MNPLPRPNHPRWLELVRPEEGAFVVLLMGSWILALSVGEIPSVAAAFWGAWAEHQEFRVTVAGIAGSLLLLAWMGWQGRGTVGRGAGFILATVRDFLPFGFMYVLYESVHCLGPELHGRVFDPLLARVDYLVFRTQAFVSLPVALFELRQVPAVAYFLAFCYSAVFIVYWGLGIYFFCSFSRRVFRQYMLSVALTSFLGYATYLLIPARGPYEAFIRPGLTEFAAWETVGGAQAIVSFADTIRALHLDRTAACDAFPSLHTAWAIIALGFAARHASWLMPVLVPWAIGTLLGAVYFQQHYLVDLVAGIPFAALGCALAAFLVDREPDAAADAPPTWTRLRAPAD